MQRKRTQREQPWSENEVSMHREIEEIGKQLGHNDRYKTQQDGMQRKERKETARNATARNAPGKAEIARTLTVCSEKARNWGALNMKNMHRAIHSDEQDNEELVK